MQRLPDEGALERACTAVRHALTRPPEHRAPGVRGPWAARLADETGERVDVHFSERAFWLWITGHRHGDLRRLVRQYGRPAESVFPTGAYFKVQAGDYGTDVNLPVPFDEENNPNFDQCIDRSA